MPSFNILRSVLLGLVLSLPFAVSATEQIPDAILVDGKEYPLQTLPLDTYLEANPKIKLQSTSSANWRGYVGTWAIEGDQLVLKSVGTPRYDEKPKNLAGIIFPGKKLPIVASWHSGVLVVPIGHTTDRGSHMGFSASASEYLIARVEKGKIVKQVKMEEEAFLRMRQAQFLAYQKTPAYKAALEESREYDKRYRKLMAEKDPDYAKIMGEVTQEESDDSFAYVFFSFNMDAYLKF